MSDLIEAREGGIVTLTMNRPDAMNALTDDLIDDLIRAFQDLGRDPEVGVIVLTGAGRAFCAGGDVKDLSGRAERTLEKRIEDLRHKQGVALAMHRCPKLIVAAVNGAAMGAGFSLALMADFRIVARSAKFGTAFAAVGFSGDFGVSWSLSRLVGPARARELLILDPRLSAEDADRLGLVTRLVEDAALMAEATAFAASLAAGPLVAWTMMKRNLNFAEHGGLAETLDWEAANQSRCAMTDDHREARAAWMEKRPPNFSGR